MKCATTSVRVTVEELGAIVNAVSGTATQQMSVVIKMKEIALTTQSSMEKDPNCSLCKANAGPHSHTAYYELPKKKIKYKKHKP